MKNDNEIFFEANHTLSLYLLNEKRLFDNTSEKDLRQGKRKFWVPLSGANILFESGKIVLVKEEKILFSDFRILKNKIDEFISENVKQLDLDYYLKNNK